MGEHRIEETEEASLVYIVSSRTARTVKQSPCHKRLALGVGVGVGVARESMVLRKEGSFVNMSHLGGGSLS